MAGGRGGEEAWWGVAQGKGLDTSTLGFPRSHVPISPTLRTPCTPHPPSSRPPSCVHARVQEGLHKFPPLTLHVSPPCPTCLGLTPSSLFSPPGLQHTCMLSRTRQRHQHTSFPLHPLHPQHNPHLPCDSGVHEGPHDRLPTPPTRAHLSTCQLPCSPPPLPHAS
jgi:hypothetical protein